MGESSKQIQRYIRLTELIPEYLNDVDEGSLPMGAGVELSYLHVGVQADVRKAQMFENAKMTLKDAQTLRKMYADDKLNKDAIKNYFKHEVKPEGTDVNKWKLSGNKIKQYFPANTSTSEMEEIILTLLESYRKSQLEKAINEKGENTDEQ